MKNQLLFTLLLVQAAQVGWAQCNPKEYTRIFNEATVLQEKGEFIEAKNRYEAAKIYACNQKEKDAADGSVDALFEEIERLRRQAQDARDIANQEKLRTKTLVESFNLKQLGDIEFQKKEFDKSFKFYEQAINKLNDMQGFQQDSVENTLRNLLTISMNEATRLQEQFKEFKRLIDEGNKYADSLLFTEAYQAYLKAWDQGTDSQGALDKLKDLELNFSRGIHPDKTLRGLRYYHLLALSAETNLRLNEPKIAGKRINEILKYRPDNLDFIEGNQAKQFISTLSRKEKNRSECYLLISNYLSSGRSGWTRPGYSFGLKIWAGEKINFWSEVSLQKFREEDLINAKSINQFDFSIYGTHKIFQVRNKIWQSTIFQARVMAGFTFGNSDIQFYERRLPYILEIPAINGRIPTVIPTEFTYLDLTLKYKEHTSDFLIECSYEIPSNSRYLNALAGLNFYYVPFPSSPSISLYAAATYHLRLNNVEFATYSLKDALLSHFATQYQLSSSEVSDFSLNLDKVGIDNNFNVRTHYREYNSGVNLKLGLLFRL